MNESDFYKSTQSNSLSGLYLLHGEEELTKQEALGRVEALLDQGMRDMNRARFRAPLATEVLAAAAQAPFFDRFRVIVVWDLADEELNKLIEARAKVPPETILLAAKRGKARDTAAVKKLAALGRVVEFAPLTRERAVSMVMREAALCGVTLDGTLARKLVELVGTDAYALRNEASKVFGYAGHGNVVTAEMLDCCVTPSPEADIFAMLNCFLRGDRKGGLRAIRIMQQNGETALRIAYFLQGRLRKMLIARELLETKTPPQTIIRELGGSPYAAEKSITAAKKCSLEMLRGAVIRLSEVDFKLKQGLATDSDSLFLVLFECFK
ncbi:MAG: DNA polymerase III subunit delta [Clostridiales bacterium]|nr:DNA polymerase III subunit delta [Clostridiales bacterium]